MLIKFRNKGVNDDSKRVKIVVTALLTPLFRTEGGQMGIIGDLRVSK